MHFDVGHLAGSLAAKILIPLLVSLLLVPTMQALKCAWGWLDRAPVPVKNAAVLVLAAIGTALAPILSALTGLPIPADLTQWDTAAVSAILSAVLGIAFKQKKQLERTKDALEALTPPPELENPFAIPESRR